MAKRGTPSLAQQRRAVREYLTDLQARLILGSQRLGFRLCPMSLGITPQGIGEIFVPSRRLFEKINPQSAPIGLIFPDGSFLCFKEIVTVGYGDEADPEPRLRRLSYSFHYQRPHNRFFFRYDHHPEIGVDHCHPLHHLHVGQWSEGTRTLPQRPRFAVSETTLDHVLFVIEHHFL